MNTSRHGGCIFCVYESSPMSSEADRVKWQTRQPKGATHRIQTERGPRDVCADHALAGTWKGGPRVTMPVSAAKLP